MAKTARTHEAVVPVAVVSAHPNYIKKMYTLAKRLSKSQGLCGMKFFAVKRQGAVDADNQGFAHAVCVALESSASGTGYV